MLLPANSPLLVQEDPEEKFYTFCYYVSGHGFGHATRVCQIVAELLKKGTPLAPLSSSPLSSAVPTRSSTPAPSTMSLSVPKLLAPTLPSVTNSPSAAAAAADGDDDAILPDSSCSSATSSTPSSPSSKSTSSSPRKTNRRNKNKNRRMNKKLMKQQQQQQQQQPEYPTIVPAPSSPSTDNSQPATEDQQPLPRKAIRHTVHIVSDAPRFIFQDVIALGATYRNAKVDSGVVQPLAYSVDRQKTIEGVKEFLAHRDEMIEAEVAWLKEVGADCVLADAPFLPCAAADAAGIPACLITNFTFDEVYRYLREGDPLDKDVMAVADAALEDYSKASLLLRLPGYIDIPSFGTEIQEMEARNLIEDDSTSSTGSRGGGDSSSVSEMDDDIMSPKITITASGRFTSTMLESTSKKVNNNNKTTDTTTVVTKKNRQQQQRRRRQVFDVPLVVRKAINTREDVLLALGVDPITIATKKMVLVSFGGQRLKQGWGNPLPEGWIGVICGLPVEHELPQGFYRSPHGVYVPDLTHAADIVIGKLGYGTCSECIAHDTPLIYVSRPQFVEEHGLIRMMERHGLSVEMTAEEFESGLWQRSILEADRQCEEEKIGRRDFELLSSREGSDDGLDSVEPLPLQEARIGSAKALSMTLRNGQYDVEEAEYEPRVWFERRLPHNGGEVCAQHLEDFLSVYK